MARNVDGTGRKPLKWRGRWRAYLTLGYQPNGEANRQYVYGVPDGECRAKLDELRDEVAKGVAQQPKGQALVQYLEEWLEQKSHEVAPRTVDAYRAELTHVTRVIGRVKLAKLKPDHV